MQRVYFDSNMAIYFVERHPLFFPRLIARMLDAAGQLLVTCVTSDLGRLEARLLPLRQNDGVLLAHYDTFFAASDTTGVVFDRRTFDLATNLRATHGLKTPDALHLAAAIAAGCDEFWTNDYRLAQAAQGHLQLVTFGSNT